MTNSRCDCNNDITAVGNPERILLDVRWASASSKAAQAVENLLIAPQSLEAALQGVATSFPSLDGEDTFDAVADRLVSEERPAPGTRPKHSVSSAKLGVTLGQQISSILALVQDAVARRNAGRATESSKTGRWYLCYKQWWTVPSLIPFKVMPCIQRRSKSYTTV